MALNHDDLSVKQILLLAAVLYAIYLPIAFGAWYFHIPRPEPTGRIVENVFFRPRMFKNGVYEGQTMRMMRYYSTEQDDRDAVLIESSNGTLKIVAPDQWSLNRRAPDQHYRFISLKAPPDGIEGKHYYIVVPSPGVPPIPSP